ncbi:MAG: shikimate dehydrogenase [Patescibacteria group bacterium]
MIITPQTKFCGLIGYPIDHSLSPAIHNAAAQFYKINAVFLAFPTTDAKSAIAAMKALGILEYSITMPLKEKVIPYLDEIEPQAKELGNANTIINRDGKLYGYNTDIDGVRLSLKGLRIKNKPVILLGAGGVAKTVAYVIHKAGGQLHILNRDLILARKLAKLYQAKYNDLQDIGHKVRDINPYLIINATPVGMGELKNQSLVPRTALYSKMVVFDLIYNPRETKLLKDAKMRGCRVISGRTMFLGQGARQFELWSRKPAPWKIIEHAFDINILKK